MSPHQTTQIHKQDLINQIRFDVENGKIWFCEQRMLLSHAYALWRLREDLVESLGKERAKRFFMRYGYYAGVQDAETAKKVRPYSDPKDAFLVGPQLHTTRGMVKVTPITLDIDIEHGKFYGVFTWEDSFEVAYHKKKNGISQEPVCWTLLGYASGYSSYFMGKQIAFTETQCEAMGHTHCHIIGKPIKEWDETTDLERSMLPDPVEEELFSLRSELDELKHRKQNDLLEQDSLFDAVGESPAFRHVCEMLNKASKSKAAVLLEGETGVGKEAFAKGLHAGSDRSNQPFVAINCACIPPELIEAELFGVERGAFTGATQSKAGKFERADKGTIFLDEVAEVGVLLLADRRLKRHGFLRDLHDLVDACNADAHLLCDLLGARVAAELLQELARDAHELVDRLNHVHGDADGARLVGDGTRNRLPDPPRRVCAEFIALAVVELLDRL